MSARSCSLGGLEDGAPHYFHSMRAMGDWRRAASTGGHSSHSEQHQEINIRDEQGISTGRRKRRKNGGEKGSHHGGEGEGGRRIVVGMKLTAACREVLTWTIAKLAHPGDHVVALHVSSFPGAGSGNSIVYQQQLASSLRTVLSVYEGICNLKQIKLQLEIVNGTKVRKVLVEAARTYEAYKLILGTTQQHAAGWSASLGKYCLKRLPSTCTVVIVEHGKVIFDRKGTQIGSPGYSVMKVLRRSVRSFGRSNKSKVSVAEVCPDDDGTMSTFSSPTTVVDDSKEIGITMECINDDRISFNDFDSASSSSSTVLHEDAAGPGSPISVLPSISNRIDGTLGSFEAFRLSYSKRRMEGSISKRRSSSLRVEKENLSLVRRRSGHRGGLDDEDSAEELDPYPTEACNSDDNESKCSVSNCSRESYVITNGAEGGRQQRPLPDRSIQKGWPLMHRSLSRDDLNMSFGQTLDRSMSVVNWALQLPHRRWDESQCEPNAGSFTLERRTCARGGELLNSGSNYHPGGSKEFSSSQVRLSFSLPHVATQSTERCDPDMVSSLMRQINRLCRDHPWVYTYEELDAATSRFSPNNLVGIGGGSQVYRGKMADGRLVAVKLLNQNRPQAEEELLTDIEINSSLKHRHIVALLGYCVDATHLILVYDFLAHGNLDDHLHSGKEAAVVEWEVRQKVAVGTARALDYLHDGCPRPVVHRDVKASNILLSKTFEPQLSDFGLAKWAPINASCIKCNDVVGTFGYLAPEYFMYGRVNEKADVYSFGVVLLELLTGRQPIDTTRPKGQENLVLWARPLLEERNIGTLIDPRLEGKYDVNELKSMMLAAALCIRHSAHCRPHMSRVLKILSGEGESLGYWPRQELTNKSMDMDENANNNNVVDGTADYGDTDIRTHLALAMLGVDDNDGGDDESNFNDQSGVLEAHSNTYLEEYLEGRISRSTSFNS